MTAKHDDEGVDAIYKAANTIIITWQTPRAQPA